MIIFMNLYKTKGFLGSWNLRFSYINEKKITIKISARFWPIFDFELKEKRSRAELSRAKNPSARALARASSARTHQLVSICAWFLKYRVSLDFFSISNSKKNRFRNKLDFLSSSKLIFTACVACKNQVRTRQKIEFVSKSIFFEFVINSQIDISKIKHR